MLRVAITALCVVGVVGCGTGGSSDSGTSSTPTHRATATDGRAPAPLVGTYRVRLTPGDIPAHAPAELSPDNSPYAWKVVIANSGGPNNGPTLSIVNPRLGPLESPALHVVGDELRLTNEECASSTGGDTFVSSSYRWKLSGTILRLSVTKGGCPDKVAETILTSRPLQRSGG